MKTSHDRLNECLAKAGISKIVYALVMPETEETIDAVFDGIAGEGRESYHNAFREAWTQKQDDVHESFFQRWVEWVKPIVAFDAVPFPFHYPTAGASEGLREAIHAYGARARIERLEPTIHVFEGEYEGYAAYARAAGIPLKSHRRSQWRSAVECVQPHDQWYLSQPSGIDGNVWSEYDAFATALALSAPQAQLMLDLSYVGCVARDFQVQTHYPNVAAVFFSLSKPAGMYYHRIGGMWSRQEYLGLFGNKWFKNISSLLIGDAFMSRYRVQELPRKYASQQQATIDAVSQELSLKLQPADVFLLGIGQPQDPDSELERFLLRGPEGEAMVRVCLTARMAHRIDPKLTPQVRARYYEQWNG